MNDIVDTLTQDLKPVRPLRTWWLWAGAALGLGLAVAFILMTYGPRSEILYMRAGIRVQNSMVMLKPLMFLVCGLSAVWAVAGLARPEGRLKLRYLLPVLAVGAAVLGSLASEVMRDGSAGLAEKLNGGATTCFSTILVGGLLGLAALWGLWLRKSATSHPVALGAMSGLACASLMASAYALHCNMDAPVYIFAVYGFAVALFTGMAALVGGRLLRW